MYFFIQDWILRWLVIKQEQYHEGKTDSSMTLRIKFSTAFKRINVTLRTIKKGKDDKKRDHLYTTVHVYVTVCLLIEYSMQVLVLLSSPTIIELETVLSK